MKIDITGLLNSVDKIDMYRREESVELNNIRKIINQFNSSYQSSNKRIIDSLNSDYNHVTNLLEDEKTTNIIVLNRMISQNMEAENKNIEILGK